MLRAIESPIPFSGSIDFAPLNDGVTHALARTKKVLDRHAGRLTQVKVLYAGGILFASNFLAGCFQPRVMTLPLTEAPVLGPNITFAAPVTQQIEVTITRTPRHSTATPIPSSPTPEATKGYDPCAELRRAMEEKEIIVFSGSNPAHKQIVPLKPVRPIFKRVANALDTFPGLNGFQPDGNGYYKWPEYPCGPPSEY